MATTHQYQDEGTIGVTGVPGTFVFDPSSVDHRYQREGTIGITGVPSARVSNASVDHRYQQEGTIGITDVPMDVYDTDASVAHRYQREGTIGITDLGSSRAAVEVITTNISITGIPLASEVSGGTGGSGRPKVRVGGLWVGKPAKVYINGLWVEKPMKRHNGTSWVPLT